MRIVEKIGTLNVGGSCSECGEEYSAPEYEGKTAVRVILRWFEEGHGYVEEPCNVCEECLLEIAKD